MTAPDRVKTTVYIDEDLHTMIDTHGARRREGNSDVINHALRHYFKWVVEQELRGFDVDGDIIKPRGEWWPETGRPPSIGPGRPKGRRKGRRGGRR